MNISEIKIDGRSELKDVACHTFGKRDIVSREGYVAYVGDNSFELVTKDNNIPFSIDDLSECKIVTDFLNRHYYILAQITSCSSDKENGVLFMHFVFFCNCKRMGSLPIIISQNAMEYLFKMWKVDRNEEKVYKRLKDQFEITNGTDSCFVFESAEKVLRTKKQDIVDDEDEETEIVDEENEKQKVLVLHGRSIKLFLSLRGKQFEEKLYVERVVKNGSRKPSNLMIGIGKLEFTDTGAMLSLKAKQFYDENKGYLDLWNVYSEKEGNFILSNADFNFDFIFFFFL